MSDLPGHSEVGLADDECECEYCGETISRMRYQEIEDAIGQHITYHCVEVGLLHNSP